MVALQHHVQQVERELHQVRTAVAAMVVLIAANGGLNVVDLFFS